MSEDDSYGDFCKAAREARKEQRAHQYDVNGALVMESGADVEVKNGGHHLILTLGNRKADFWPASGKYFLRAERKYGTGFHRLMKHLKTV